MGREYERVVDLFFEDSGGANPTEEGQTRYVSGDLVAYLGGAAVSLTQSGVLPPATAQCEMLISVDGATFTPQLPLVGDGWLCNDEGQLLVKG